MGFKAAKKVAKRAAEVILLNLPITVLLAVSVSALPLAANSTSGAPRAALMVALLVCAGLAGASIWLRSSHSGTYKDIAERLARTLSGGGLPVIVALGLLASKTDSGQAQVAQRDLVHHVLVAAKRTSSHAKESSQTRTAFYQLKKDDGLLHLINAEWGGAAPRRTMGDQGEHDGDLLQFTLNPLRGKRVDDLRKQESFLDVLEMGSLQYRSCIAVAVGIRDVNEVAGLLVAVSPEPKAFAETDLEALRLLAGILAAALAHVHSL